MAVPRKWHFQTATFTPKGQGCHWDLYRDETVHFNVPNRAATNVPEEETVMVCLQVTQFKEINGHSPDESATRDF